MDDPELKLPGFDAATGRPNQSEANKVNKQDKTGLTSVQNAAVQSTC